ncbi:MAG: efflux RND transporter periplasmic adaptor subunit [Candidatus Cloacimonetes bacterium]|nr:efflux RND transporter periplasmic adaptor subunit [Candidatus Cloacimonadota bacterium]
MKKIIIISILLLVLLTGCDQDKNDEVKKSIPVMIYTTHPDEIASYLKLNGGLEATTDLDLYSMSSEKIKKLHVHEGEKVSAGQLLMEQVSDMAQESVKLGLAGANAARAQNDLAEKEYIRMQKLLAEKAITQQQFDQIEMQKSAATAGLELAEAQLEQARQQLNYTKVFAPAAGEVAMINYEVGDMVPAGVPVFKLVNNRSMVARLQAVEVDLVKLYVGQDVIARFPAFGEEEFQGKVISIDSAISPVTRTLEVKVALTNGMDQLRSGMYGEFRMITKAREGVIVLTDSAIMTQTKLRIDKNGKQIAEKEYYVFMAVDGKAAMRPVKTGIHSLGRLEIVDGLAMGEQVIVVGQNIVKAGDEIRIVN